MLIDFTVSNFRSYRDEATFSMEAGDEEFASTSLLDIPHVTNVKLLPLSAIYGANASGKSTLVKALQHLQTMLRRGFIMEQQPFLLDTESAEKVTRYEISYVSAGIVWKYTLSILKNQLLEESLYRGIDGDEMVFERTADTAKPGNIFQEGASRMDKALTKAFMEALGADKPYLGYATLLKIGGLDKSVGSAYSWFENTLQIMDVNHAHKKLGELLYSQQERYAQALAHADTGISGLVPERISKEEYELLDKRIPTVLRKENDEEVPYRIKAVHQKKDGDTVRFSFMDESDGTLRFMNLLPALMEGKQRPQVYIIDELDRSLHSALSRSLLEQQRKLAEEKVPQQLIFTTHDTSFIDKELLRMDELWVVEKNQEQSSQLISFAEYDNVDKLANHRQSYLDGRMGGIPRITSPF